MPLTSWEDLSFCGLRWENEGKDLRLFVAGNSEFDLVATWATNLRLDLEWKIAGGLPRGGPLLSVKGSLEPITDQRLRLTLDFGPDGVLSFDCEELFVESADGERERISPDET